MFDFTFEQSQAYEKHFSVGPQFNSFTFDKLTVDHARPADFFAALDAAVAEYDRMLFKNLMRFEWIDRHIVYGNFSRMNMPRNARNRPRDYASAVFYHKYTNRSRRWFFHTFNRVIMGYADDLFKDFDQLDGLTYDFTFPFQYMTLECLFFVYLLKERMNLLWEGEKHKMSLREFRDYVMAYGSDRNYKFDENMKCYTCGWMDSPFYAKLFPPLPALNTKPKEKKKT